MLTLTLFGINDSLRATTARSGGVTATITERREAKAGSSQTPALASHMPGPISLSFRRTKRPIQQHQTRLRLIHRLPRQNLNDDVVACFPFNRPSHPSFVVLRTPSQPHTPYNPCRKDPCKAALNSRKSLQRGKQQ